MSEPEASEKGAVRTPLTDLLGIRYPVVQAATGFSLVVPDEVPMTRVPTAEELGLIRNRLDPTGTRERELG